MGTIAAISVRLQAETAEFIKGISQTASMVQKLQTDVQKTAAVIGKPMDKIGTAIKAAAVTAGGGFLALVTSGVRANASMEAYQRTLSTVMADAKMAGETLDWVKKYAAATPFEMPGLVDATVKLQAMGLQAQKFLPIAGDMAAVFQSSGKTVSDAAEAINDAMMGEFERLKEFGIKLQATDFKAGGIYAGKTYAEALEAEFKKHNFAGAAEALSTGFLGRLSTLTDVVGTKIQEITKPIFENLSNKMGGLMETINQLETNGTLKKWAEDAKASFESLWGTVEKVMGFLVNVGKGIVDHWGVIEPILAGIVGGFMAFKTIEGIIKAVTFAQAALNLVMAANPIALIVIGIAALVAGGVALYRNWDTIKEKAKELWAKIVGIGNTIKTSLVTIWTNIKTSAIEKWNDIIGGIVNTVANAKNAIIEKAKAVATGFWQGLMSMKSWLIGKVWDWVKSVLPDPIEKALGIHSPSKVMADFGKMSAVGLAVGLSKNTQEVTSAVQDIQTQTETELTTYVNMWLEKTQLIKTEVLAKFQELQKQVLDLVILIKNSTLTTFQEMVDGSKDIGTTLMQQLLDGVNSVKPQIFSVVDEIADKFQSLNNIAISAPSVSGGGSYSVPTTPSFGGGIDYGTSVTEAGGWDAWDRQVTNDLMNEGWRYDSNNVLQPPGMASGGTVTSSGLALVGEEGPEILNLPRNAEVRPLDRAGGGINVSVTIKEMHNHNEFDYKRNIDKIGEELVRRMRQKGVMR